MDHNRFYRLSSVLVIGFLFIACQQNAQQLQQAAQNVITGPYFYTRSSSLCLQTHVISGPNNIILSTQALVPASREFWIAPDGTGRIRQGSTGEPTFFSQQERQQWVSQGSPVFDAGIDEQFGSGGLVAVDAQALPRTTNNLYNALQVETQKMNRSGDGGIAETVRDIMGEQPVPDEVQREMYNVVRQLPHAIVQPNSADSIGRVGTVIRIPDSLNGMQVEHVLIFDSQSYQLLETDDVLVASAPWLQIQQPTSFCRTTYHTRGTVSTTLLTQ